MRPVVLVTGGAGYVGSHACKALARAGFLPVTYDNLSFGHRRAVKWGPLEHGDILDSFRLQEVMRKYQPAAVLHFAGLSYVGESTVDPAKYYRNNVVGSISLVDAMRNTGLNAIVFSSTCAVYGDSAGSVISEEGVGEPLSPYGASKKTVERILADYGLAYGIRSISLRYFNAAGADPDGEIGEDHDPETHLIPLLLDVAAGVRPEATIFGTDHPTNDGTCVRDYIHVSDLADGHVAALRRLQNENAPRAINLGTGNGVSVAEVIEAVRRVTGAAIPIVRGAKRAGDPPSLVADASLAHRELGWRPAHTSIDEVVRTAWAWHQSERGRRRFVANPSDVREPSAGTA